MTTIITTVGTSLLGNAKRTLGKSTLADDEILQYMQNNAVEKVSAETNSLSRLISDNCRIILIHSQTKDGDLCAQSLCRFYAAFSNIETVIVRKIECLDYSHNQFKIRGLRSLVSTLINLIRMERFEGHDVCINATGGFKAEVAYATMVGLMYDVPVYYIHEVFQDIIQMPPVPLDWDYSLIAEHESLFKWISVEERSSAEIDKMNLPHDIYSLLSDENGMISLSPAGYVLYELYLDRIRETQATPVLLSTEARKTYEADDNLSLRFDELLSDVRLPIMQNKYSLYLYNSDCMLYRCDKGPESIIYFKKKNEGIFVCALFSNTREFEKVIQKRIIKDDYYNFTEWIPIKR